MSGSNLHNRLKINAVDKNYYVFFNKFIMPSDNIKRNYLHDRKKTKSV